MLDETKNEWYFNVKSRNKRVWCKYSFESPLKISVLFEKKKTDLEDKILFSYADALLNFLPIMMINAVLLTLQRRLQPQEWN